MKKYISRSTKWFAIVALIGVALLVEGIVLIVITHPDISLKIALTSLGGVTSIIFGISFFAENSRTLIIDDDKIFFPRGVEKNGKFVSHKTVINLDEIHSIKSEMYKGDGIISGDCFFHTIKLKDRTKITVTLYAYGKDAEREILETIRKNIT